MGDHRPRSRARRLAVQALYQCLLTDDPAGEVVRQFEAERNLGRADRDYFSALVEDACAHRVALDALLDPLLDRPLAQIDPVEHAILLIGALELHHRPDVPHAVVIDEAVTLTHLFGAEQAHRFVNAVLDKLAKRQG